MDGRVGRGTGRRVHRPCRERLRGAPGTVSRSLVGNPIGPVTPPVAHHAVRNSVRTARATAADEYIEPPKNARAVPPGTDVSALVGKPRGPVTPRRPTTRYGRRC